MIGAQTNAPRYRYQGTDFGADAFQEVSWQAHAMIAADTSASSTSIPRY
jgi:hypothetical protein